MTVTWPDDSELDGASLSKIDPESRGAIHRSRVPVLVPRSLASSTRVVSTDAFVAASATIGGATVSVHATRIAHRHDSVPEAQGSHRIRAAHGFVTQNEGIWSASWVEHGAAYAIDVECVEATDARCSSDAYVLELAEDLAYVGGRGARR